MNSGHKILLVAAASELTLGFTWWLAWYFKLIPDLQHPLDFISSLTSILIYLLGLVALNYLFFYRFPIKKSGEFIDNFVVPLCSNLTILQAATVSILAGLGEELFFRSFLLILFQDLIGWPAALVITSFLFAYLHFISKTKEYLQIFLVYCFVGLIFGLIRYQTNSDLIPIATHAIYDFLAIIFVKYQLRDSEATVV